MNGKLPGLYALALFFTLSPAQAASFDCKQARAADEIAICTHGELGELDVKMATLYDVAQHLVGMGVRGDMQDRQHDFLTMRKACGKDISCLKKTYGQRIDALEQQLNAIYKGGPY
ncbi:MAG: hypothetical protein PW790_11495 [Parvibaculaceae bacterium]|nr:hypothetical protein [Parvibaculaceae bacterium]